VDLDAGGRSGYHLPGDVPQAGHRWGVIEGITYLLMARMKDEKAISRKLNAES
jgi:hypothetical protein